jgi:hypothetical protein
LQAFCKAEFSGKGCKKSTHTSLVTAILLSASSCFKKAVDLKVYKKVGLKKVGLKKV